MYNIFWYLFILNIIMYVKNYNKLVEKYFNKISIFKILFKSFTNFVIIYKMKSYFYLFEKWK